MRMREILRGAMSEENVELVRRAFDAFERRDRAAWLALCDEWLEIEPVGDWPDAPSIRGREAAWEFFVTGDEPWESTPYEITEHANAGNDQVVVHQQRQMRGRSSGIEVEYDYWLLATLRNGRAIRLQWFDTRHEALEAAGLSD
jgi:ketosteroid isomerase-like protein